MPKGSPEFIEQRKEEIVNACERLYRTKNFNEITLNDIAQETSFTRTSIYNYFQTKEEIFLALLKREFELWIKSLNKTMETVEAMTKDEFASMLANSLAEREQLLKILSINNYYLEERCRLEQLISFKKVFGKAIRTVSDCLKKYFPDMTTIEEQNFIYIFFPFLLGIYPFTHSTEKQKEAIKKAGVSYVFMNIYDLTYKCVKTILDNN